MIVVYLMEFSDGQTYVGVTKNFHARVKQHVFVIRKRTHHNPRVMAAWDRCGVPNFTVVASVLWGTKEDVENDVIASLEPTLNVRRECNRTLTHEGVTLTLAEWAAKNGITYKKWIKRLELHWTEEEAVGIKKRTPLVVNYRAVLDPESPTGPLSL